MTETNRIRRWTAAVIPSLLMSALVLLTMPGCSHDAFLLKSRESVDFANYKRPLYGQITDRIKHKISSRLGEGANTRDRYFIIPFAYQNRANDPEFSHSFMTIVRVLADNKQPRQNIGLKTGTFRNREFEAFNISWLPADFMTNPNLCVFKGIGARLDPARNQCPTLPGKNCNLENTIKLGANVQNAVCMWGPYEITKEGFDLGMKRKELLDEGTIRYRADDRLTRKDRTAINCFHAMAGLDELYPNGGIFGTGFMMWGINGTSRVLLEYTDKAKIRGQLLEPVNDKEDRYGFVYAPAMDSDKIYNPFEKASAYHD